jgi:hypothetical protein
MCRLGIHPSFPSHAASCSATAVAAEELIALHPSVYAKEQ